MRWERAFSRELYMKKKKIDKITFKHEQEMTIMNRSHRSPSLLGGVNPSSLHQSERVQNPKKNVQIDYGPSD